MLPDCALAGFKGIEPLNIKHNPKTVASNNIFFIFSHLFFAFGFSVMSVEKFNDFLY
jgi:hypothetical protein